MVCLVGAATVDELPEQLIEIIRCMTYNKAVRNRNNQQKRKGEYAHGSAQFNVSRRKRSQH